MTGSSLLSELGKKRDNLLSKITDSLVEDERFKAAWLTGSLGRGDADAVSDLDITAVVAQNVAHQVCKHSEMVTTQPSRARIMIFETFGDIGFVYENNHNAPSGGTATTVLYAQSGIVVDWVLIPEEGAQRPQLSQLLFAEKDIPLLEIPATNSLETRLKEAANMIGFFWMMVVVTAKYLIRDDQVFVARTLEDLTRLVYEIKRQLTGQPWQYHRGSYTKWLTTRSEQLLLLHELCQQMVGLETAVSELGGKIWTSAHESVEQWLKLAEDAIHT